MYVDVCSIEPKKKETGPLGLHILSAAVYIHITVVTKRLFSALASFFPLLYLYQDRRDGRIEVPSFCFPSLRLCCFISDLSRGPNGRYCVYDADVNYPNDAAVA